MKKLSFGFFGAGNMTHAIARGIYTYFPKSRFYFYTPTKTKAKNLSLEFLGEYVDEISSMPLDLDFYVLGFKPQNLIEFNFPFKSSAKVISILAGVETLQIQNKFNIDQVLRIMPNTPMRVGHGVTLAFFSSSFNLDSKQLLKDIFSNFSYWVQVNNDSEIDKLTVYTGSMPGILFDIFKMFEDSLSKWELDGISKKELLIKAILGSVLLADNERDKSFEELRNEVTSKKGMTEVAIKTLNDSNLSSIVHQSFMNAYKRGLELKEGK